MKVNMRYGRVCCVVFSCMTPVFAWGPTGHRIVARIAENHLTPVAHEQVKSVLHGYRLVDVANWADEMRVSPSWSQYDTWHYLTIPDGVDWQVPGLAFLSNPDTLYTALLFHQQQLLRSHQSGDAVTESVALKWLTHLVGDAHQPLHVGRADDRGGNRCYVRWFQGRYYLTLHQVWDSRLITHTQLSYSEYADYLDHITLPQLRQWQSDDVLTWLRESYEMHRHIYPDGESVDRPYCMQKRPVWGDDHTPPIPSLGYRYIHQVKPILERSLQKAGIRLAGIINRIYDPHYQLKG